MKHSNPHWPSALVLAGTLVLSFRSPAQTASSNTEPLEAEVATTNTTVPDEQAIHTNEDGQAASGRAWMKALQAHSRSGRQGELVIYGNDAEVKKGETVDSVVVFGGSAKVHGKVRQDVVVFGGETEVDGEVDGDVVTFLGGLTVRSNAVVKGDAVSFLGGVTVETNASVQGDAVTFAGKVDVAEGGTVKGDVVPFSLGRGKWGLPDWFQKWLVHCVFKLRPLALQVGWIWVIAGFFFLLYLLIAAAVPRPVQACVNELNQRPATTFLLGLAAKLIVPLVFLVLALTGVGLVVVPFIVVALFLGTAVGKVALLEWAGLRLGRTFGNPAWQKPLVAFLLGTLLLTLFYLVWFIGLAVFLLFSIWGLGIAASAAFGGLRRESPPRTMPPQPLREPAPQAPPAAGNPVDLGQGSGSFAQAASATAVLAPPVQPAAQPVVPYPRAGFWERMGAGFLDVVLVSLAIGFIHGPLGLLRPLIGGPPSFLLVAVAYFAGMWSWKGTTIGGIVLGLKVVRLDQQPLTFAVSLVRGLMAAFSVVVLFLGFLWIIWDREKQGWHDMIAGTVVLKLPRGTPLLCL